MRTFLFGLFIFMAWHTSEWSRRTDEIERNRPADRHDVASAPEVELTTMDGGTGIPPRHP